MTKTCHKGHALMADNLSPRGACKQCARDRAAKWAATNQERHRENCARWRARNPERKRELNAQWAAANPEKVRGQIARWEAANEERVRARRVRAEARRRSRLAQATCVPASAGEVEAAARGCDHEGPFQLDHIFPVAHGGCAAAHNLQWLCGPCNRAKSDCLPPVGAGCPIVNGS